jgi:hypothetical protein
LTRSPQDLQVYVTDPGAIKQIIMDTETFPPPALFLQ